MWTEILVKEDQINKLPDSGSKHLLKYGKRLTNYIFALYITDIP